MLESLYLSKDGRGIDTPALKVTLVGEQVLAVVLLQRVGSARARSDTQLGRDVLPCLLVRALKQIKIMLLNFSIIENLSISV